MSLDLITSYDAAVETLEGELDATAAGDRVEASFYLIEPGRSTTRLLEALRHAAERGVELRLSVDGTIASRFARFWERTRTSFPSLRRLARDFPGRVKAVARRVPDHSKYAVFERAGGTSTALVGGMNLGDRFRPWRDFMVHLSGPSVDVLTRKLRGRHEGANGAVEFIANAPHAGRFEVRAALRRFAEEPRFVSYRIAMAYIDRAGVAILGRALSRGASVDLVLPREANVYQHSNLRSLAELRARSPRFRAWLCPDMVHAKAIVARDETGAAASFIGSANLKRNSFRMFAELVAVVSDPSFNAALDRELDRLVAGCEPVLGPVPFNGWLAGLEDLMG